MLGGCAPPCGFTPASSPAQRYADLLSAAIGRRPKVVVASYRYAPVETPPGAPSLSWNHAKTISIDGRVALVGGHNLWGADYIQGYYLSRPLTGEKLVKWLGAYRDVVAPSRSL